MKYELDKTSGSARRGRLVFERTTNGYRSA